MPRKRNMPGTLIAILAALCGVLLYACAGGASAPPADSGTAPTPPVETVCETPAPTPEPPAPPPPPEPITVSMAVIGDIMVHSPQFKDAYDAATGEYDFSYQLRAVQQYLEAADITVGNLETTFAGGPNYSGYPTFNTPAALAADLRAAGVDLLSTANNHCMDKGLKGLSATLEELDAVGIAHVGTYASQEARDAHGGVTVMDVEGITIAFLSYTYGTNGIPVPSSAPYAVNLLYTDYMTNLSIVNEAQITADMAYARSLGTDLICVMAHWGNEYKTKQNSHQEALAELFIENGADLILGGHPHVLQPFETRTVTLEDGMERTGFVSYSLGNFISSQKDRYTNTSVILNIEITKDLETNETVIGEISYVPVYMLHRGAGAAEQYVLLDAYAAAAAFEGGGTELITAGQYDAIRAAIADVHTILGPDADVFYEGESLSPAA